MPDSYGRYGYPSTSAGFGRQSSAEYANIGYGGSLEDVAHLPHAKPSFGAGSGYNRGSWSSYNEFSRSDYLNVFP